MNVYLVRHTAPLLEASYCYGHSDVELNISFKNEYARLKKHLPTQIDAIYTSPLKRCQLLANKIEKVTLAPLFIDDRLKEMNFGQWELQQWDAINQHQLKDWMNDFVTTNTPGGESFIELNSRVQDFIKSILPLSGSPKNIVIITHAGVIRCFLNFILELPLKNTFKVKIDFGSVTHLEINPNSAYDKLIFFNK